MATETQGAVRTLQNKIKVKWTLAEKYLRKSRQTSSTPQRIQATHRSQAYVNQTLALIATLPEELRAEALQDDPRKKN